MSLQDVSKEIVTADVQVPFESHNCPVSTSRRRFGNVTYLRLENSDLSVFLSKRSIVRKFERTDTSDITKAPMPRIVLGS